MPAIATRWRDLVSLRPADANAMAGALADRCLHNFIGGGPPGRDSLLAMNDRQSVGHSFDGIEEMTRLDQSVQDNR
jgi:predicted Abi (CAAX) family protease